MDLDDRNMTVPLCDQCSTKVLRPERCVVLDGKPCSACAKDLKLEQAIKALGVCTKKKHQKRRALRTVMNENHDPLIHKFPPEISSQIFIQYAIASHRYMKMLLYLGAICQKWRRLAWATPELWTSVFLPVGTGGISGRSNHPKKLLVRWLERSGGLPLTITFISRILGKDYGYHGVANVLNKHSARWQDIHLTIPARHLHLFSGSLEGNTVGQLSQLSLQLPENGYNSRGESLQVSGGGYVSRFPPFRMKCKASPRTLILTTLPLIYVDILWDNLTTVSLNDIGCDECIELIRRCPRLESINLQAITTSSGIFPTPNSRIPHSHLHSLGISRIHRQTIIVQILDSLCLPSLEQWTHSSFFCPLNNMISFIEYSSFRLKTLRIYGDKNTYDQIHNLLCHLPSLENLQLDPPDNYQLPTDELLDLLCASGEPPPFLPRLQTLQFSNLPFTWESLPRIFASLNRRSLRVNIMHHSRYNTNANIKDATVEGLLELVDEGFNLSILKEGSDVLEEYRKKRWRQTLSPINTSHT